MNTELYALLREPFSPAVVTRLARLTESTRARFELALFAANFDKPALPPILMLPRFPKQYIAHHKAVIREARGRIDAFLANPSAESWGPLVRDYRVEHAAAQCLYAVVARLGDDEEMRELKRLFTGEGLLGRGLQEERGRGKRAR